MFALDGDFVRRLTRWAFQEGVVEAVAVVGSYANGSARPDSDLDVIILTAAAPAFVSDTRWTRAFGHVTTIAIEHYAPVESVRVRYADHGEVEFGFAPPTWADSETVDAGTAGVVADGMLIFVDKRGRLAKLSRAVLQK